MNKVFFLAFALVCCIAPVANAQKIAAGAHLGFSKLTGDLSGGGLNWILDGKYYLTDKLTVGAEYNSSGMVSLNEGVGVYGGRQFLAKSEYYFTTKKVRPYAGLGIGFAGVSTPEVTINDQVAYERTSRTNFSLSPRLGLMLGGFGIEFQYNLAGKTPKETELSQANKGFTFWTLNLGYVYTLDLND